MIYAALQTLERELERQGYLTRKSGKLELTPKAVRRLGAAALTKVFRQLDARGRGDHDVRDAGAAGEATGRQPGVAVRRRAAARRRPYRAQRAAAAGG